MSQNLINVKKISVTGGKGGTGKTLIAVNLAVYYAKLGYKVLLIDSDVENPNSNILLGKALTDSDVERTHIDMFVPKFSPDKCIKCGKCRDACYRHAILQFPDQFPSLMEPMCSGCTICKRVCPTDAISSGKRSIGSRFFMKNVHNNLDLLIGELNPGEAISVLIVENLIEQTYELQRKNNYDIIITDTAPGAHCDVEKALSLADLTLCVTEPTPFGEHDLKRILRLIQLSGQNAQIILNRSTLTDYKEPILQVASDFNIKILGEIPIDNIVIEDYAKGIPFVLDSREFPAKQAFLSILANVKKIMALESV
ncbi:P-loop NTPase [Promethearchaeum syntrophicum]|uniref:P-loop NTPase n=1 Tax=Promethearchaeum syntrophicum TaxID=2594042 RepID=A0A5B9D6H4_9ARCH|nr:P-loop NTPase [Candidatus Prometheoarchaeum syntrophicum]QEE14605.1 Ketoisovalerate oxidoreductase subunit VorD [Candidatus Prometheoarchaeum syntrophicum]